MGRPREAADAVLAARTPAEITANLGMTPATIEGYPHRAVPGEEDFDFVHGLQRSFRITQHRSRDRVA